MNRRNFVKRVGLSLAAFGSFLKLSSASSGGYSEMVLDGQKTYGFYNGDEFTIDECMDGIDDLTKTVNSKFGYNLKPMDLYVKSLRKSFIVELKSISYSGQLSKVIISFNFKKKEII